MTRSASEHPPAAPTAAPRPTRIRTVPRAAIEALVARLQKDNTMTHETEHDAVPPGPEAPEDQAHEAVEAMRAAGTDRPAVKRGILDAGRQHAGFLERHGMSPEDWR